MRVRQGRIAARANLARLLHVAPETDLRTVPDLPVAEVPAEVEPLYRLAAAARPELGARLAAVARDQKQVELARKRYYPDFGIGLVYQMLTEENALAPSANGRDTLGLAIDFDIPIYLDKLAAGVREAESRAVADAERYVDLRDQTYEEVTQLVAEAAAQREILSRYRQSILPNSEQALEVAVADYAAGERDFVTLITLWQEVLSVELQAARLESELGKTLVRLEQVVGGRLDVAPF